jgi:hypothetical protein
MKKSILLVACLSLLTIGAISVSCSKDDEWKGCSCTIDYGDGDVETETATAATLKAEGINSCAEATAYLRNEEGYNATCTDL